MIFTKNIIKIYRKEKASKAISNVIIIGLSSQV